MGRLVENENRVKKTDKRGNWVKMWRNREINGGEGRK